MKKVKANTSFQINDINERLKDIYKLIGVLENKIDTLEKKTVDHMLRLKNNECISDKFIIENHPYNDLSPQRSKDVLRGLKNYILIDVSESNYFAPIKFPKIKKVTLEQIYTKTPEFMDHTTPVFIISEDGTRSVLACDYLSKQGFYNVTNISGGYQFWPRAKKIKKSA